MANLFSKIKVSPSINETNVFDLGQMHLTTANFNQLLPVYHRYLHVGDKFTLKNINSFARLAPLAVPTYGRCKLNFVNVFVPYKFINKTAESFIEGKNFEEGDEVHGRSFRCWDMVRWLTEQQCATQVDTYHSGCIALRVKIGSAPVKWVYYELTPLGKYWYKFFTMLGYAIPRGFYFSNDSSADAKYAQSILFNAHPLLSYFKAYADYFAFNDGKVNSAFDNIKFVLNKIRERVDDGDYEFWRDVDEGVIDLYYLLGEAGFQNKLCFEPDVITTATSSYNGSLKNGSDFSLGINDNINYQDEMNIYTSPEGAKSQQVADDFITAKTIKSLLAFENFVRKSNYVINEIGQQILARFGVKTSEFDRTTSTLFGRSYVDLQIGDVTATASTDDAKLGDYSGKGIISGNGNGCSFTAQDSGMFFVLAYISVDPIYYQGIERECLKITSADYYKPEFEGIGPQPISMGEIYAQPTPEGLTSQNDLWESVFGYTSRYVDLKIPHHQITGDFRTDAYNAFHFGRDMKNIYNQQQKAENPNVIYANQFGSEFNRIFTDMNDDIEHFYLTMFFDVSLVSKMKALQSTLDLGDQFTVDASNTSKIYTT